MTEKQKAAYEWAKSHDYPSMAARYARDLASLVDDLKKELDELKIQYRVEYCQDGLKYQCKRLGELRKKYQEAVECIEAVAEQFDKGACHDDYAEAAIERWRFGQRPEEQEVMK